MKVSYISFIVLPSASAFVADTPRRKTRLTPLLDVTRGGPDDAVDRRDFVKTAVSSVVTIGLLGVGGEPAFATGRATLDQTFERYAPRIRAGGEFYQGEFKQMVAKGDFQAIKEATEGVPPRKKGDLQKIDAGVTARARSAGQFSEDRVLAAADLFASAFSSQNSISPKTKKMKESVEKVREAVKEMNLLAKQGTGEASGGGGLFGFGAKKPSEAELKQKIKQLYVVGGNAWNEYVAVANENLALQFDRFEFVK